MDEAQLAEAAKAVKSAHRAAVLAVIAVMVAVVVLAIDHSIKRAIIDEAQRVREIVDEFKTAVRDGTSAVGAAGAGSSGHRVPDGGVADDPPASAPVVPDANGTPGAARGRAGGAARRTSGDG